MTRNPDAAQHDPGVRDRETRTADTLAMLTTPGVDVWVATASAAGAPYLVPVSLAWVNDRAVIAVAKSSLTATNLTTSREARLAVDHVFTMFCAVLDQLLDYSERSADYRRMLSGLEIPSEVRPSRATTVTPMRFVSAIPVRGSTMCE